MRALPRWLVAWVGRLALGKMGATVKVPAKLVTLSSIIDKYKISSIDLLKVDVEGAEIAVLNGVEARHWPRIKQLAMEVESFAAVAAVTKLLKPHGFKVTSVASERERSPGVQSEVSMVYATRA